MDNYLSLAIDRNSLVALRGSLYHFLYGLLIETQVLFLRSIYKLHLHSARMFRFLTGNGVSYPFLLYILGDRYSNDDHIHDNILNVFLDIGDYILFSLCGGLHYIYLFLHEIVQDFVYIVSFGLNDYVLVTFLGYERNNYLRNRVFSFSLFLLRSVEPRSSAFRALSYLRSSWGPLMATPLTSDLNEFDFHGYRIAYL